MTVSDWSQSIYLLTELQLVQGMLLLGERKKRDRGEPREGGGSRDRDRKERLGEGGQMESERWEDKEERWCVRGWWETAAMESER